MGQNQVKASLQMRTKALSVLDGLTLKFSGVHEWKKLTYERFLHEIQLLNSIMDELSRDSEKTVSFSTECKSQHPLLWKASTRIICEKVEKESGVVLSTKMLSLRRFIRLYGDIMHQMSAASAASAASTVQYDPTSSSDFCASLIMDGLDTTSLSSLQPSEECCICMERDCELMLPCTHGFCEECIEQWRHCSNRPRRSSQENTCPICRQELQGPENHWILADSSPPPVANVKDLVLGLVDKAEGVSGSASISTTNHQTDNSSHDSRTADVTLSMSSTPEGFTLVSVADSATRDSP